MVECVFDGDEDEDNEDGDEIDAEDVDSSKINKKGSNNVVKCRNKYIVLSDYVA